MFKIKKANITDDPGNDGIWVLDLATESALYIPFSLCIVIADALQFSDPDVLGSCEMAGYIEIYYDYDDSIQLSDGSEVVVIEKEWVSEFVKQLWDLV